MTDSKSIKGNVYVNSIASSLEFYLLKLKFYIIYGTWQHSHKYFLYNPSSNNIWLQLTHFTNPKFILG